MDGAPFVIVRADAKEDEVALTLGIETFGVGELGGLGRLWPSFFRSLLK